MSLDTITLQAVIDECSVFAESKIIAIEQYDDMEIGLVLKGPAGRHALAISVQPDFARIYRTEPARKGTGFSALLNVLRDHLLAGVLHSIEAVPNERIVDIRCSGRTPLGWRSYRLIAELIDRHTTLVLTTDPDLAILETLRRISTGGREIKPGALYESPVPLRKIPLLEATSSHIDAASEETTSKDISRMLTRSIGGLSPAMAREIIGKAGLTDEERIERISEQERKICLWESMQVMIRRLRSKAWTPCIGRDNHGKPLILSALPIYSLPSEQIETFDTVVSAVDQFYIERIEEEKRRQRTMQMNRVIDEEIKRLDRLIQHLWMDVDRTEREAEFRKYGDLLTAHLTQLKRGQTEAKIKDYYQPDHPMITIALNPDLNPAKNAERYFKQARKARDGRVIVEKRLLRSEERLEKVRAIQDQLRDNTDEHVLERTYKACVRMGLIKAKKVSSHSPLAKKRKALEIHPRRFLTSDHHLLLVGRNNKENEVLTKTASPDDIWLHARDIRGSHVIMKRQDKKVVPSKKTLYEAACLTAYFSKGRGSATVPVDYTERRYVRKQKNGGPGQVIFTHEKTLFVAPKLNLKEADSVKKDN